MIVARLRRPVGGRAPRRPLPDRHNGYLASTTSRKIAVGTTDRATVCHHLARSSSFLVFEVRDGQIVSKTARDRQSDTCGQHLSFVQVLEGCDAVLCGGIGQGAAVSLEANGIEPVVTAGPHSIDEALSLYLEGKLATTTERVCLCG